MKEKIVLLLVIFILIPISLYADSIVVNGSFETTPAAIGSGSWSVFDSIEGWTKTAGTSGIEVRNNVAGIAYDGNNFVELDSHNSDNTNSGMYQKVTTIPDLQYILSYFYAPRIGVSAASNGIQLYFNDILLETVTDYSDTNNAWRLVSYFVTGTGSDTITFKATGTDDSLGGSIDKVSMDLTAVPDAGSTLLLLGFAFVPVAISYRWRQK